MSPDELKRELGSTGAVASMLGVSHQTIKNWASGRARPTAVTVRLLHLLGRLKREAPDVFTSLIGWTGDDTRSVRERLDEIGTPAYVAEYLGVSRPVIDAWRSGATQRVAPLVRLLDVMDLVRLVSPGVLGERPRPVAVAPDAAATVETANKRDAALDAARRAVAVARRLGTAQEVERWEALLASLEVQA